jgi:hypothetical protein
MKSGAWAVLLGMAAASIAADACAAEFMSSATEDGRVAIAISGAISPGDSDNLKSAVKVATDAGKRVSSIRLNSAGGNLVEGAKLAELVQLAKLATDVGAGTTCASACFLVFAAGQTKSADYTARIGVHGASDRTGAETAQSGAATILMARLAKALGVPPAIIGRMVVTPPTQIMWLSPADLQSMAVTMVGKPSQAAVPPQAENIRQPPPGGPASTVAGATASTAQSWTGFVEQATATSAQQNDGKPRYLHGCQPAQKVCITGITYVDTAGKEIAIKEVKDLNEAVVSREVCAFNQQRDIRVCKDWDKATTHRDMKNARGEWYKVAD